MAVIRVEKKKNYVVMAKFHLRDKRLSLKAKGMMSFLLALPDDWEYTIEGLVTQLKDGTTAVRAALKELEACGYMKIGRERDKAGRLRGAVYTIYEKPAEETAETPAAQGDKPNVEKAKQGAPVHENPTCEKRRVGNRRQLNIDRLNNNIQSNKPLNNDLLSKDRVSKERKSKERKAAPSCSPQLSEAMHDFEEMRRKMRRPLTEKAKEMILKKLAKLAGGDEEKEIAILQQSIMNGWQGVFPLHEDGNQYGREKSVKDLADEAVEKLRKAGMLDDERGESEGYQNPFGVFENVSEHKSRQ